MQQKHILFASYEIHPITAGGCGVFIWHAINELLETTDYKITLLLDIPKFECENFINNYRTTLSHPERLNVVCLSDRIPWEFLNMEVFDNIFMFKSYMFYRVIESIVQEENVDYVEFFDYVGIGYFTVNAKKYEGKFKNTILGIRAHCTVDLMDIEQLQVDFSKEKVVMFQMEKIALQNADIVLVQTEPWRDLYSKRYGIDLEHIIISEPPMNNKDFPKYEPHDNHNVLFYGRVFQLKGIDDYIQAGVQYLTKYPNSTTKFYIVGYDSVTKDGDSYTSYLKGKIPERYKERFIFTGKLNRMEFKKVLDDIQVAIFPNYVESFCYSIHELYEAGVPLIYRDIPAFNKYFNEKQNCRGFSNSISEIVTYLEQMLLEEARATIPKKLLMQPLAEVYEHVLNHKYLAQQISKEENLPGVSIMLIDERVNQLTWVKKYNPIILHKVKKQDLIPIDILGKQFWIEETRLGDELKNHIIIIDNNIQMQEEMLLKGINILSKTDIRFVDYLEKRNNVIKHRKSDIYLDNMFERYDYIPPIIFKNTKKYITEIFDFRLREQGILDKLRCRGYTLLEPYEVVGESTIITTLYREADILYAHRKTIQEEWDPLLFAKFCTMGMKESETIEAELAYDRNRVIYLRIKEYLYKRNSKLSYVLLKFFERIKDMYKRYIG